MWEIYANKQWLTSLHFAAAGRYETPALGLFTDYTSAFLVNPPPQTQSTEVKSNQKVETEINV